MRLLRAMVAAFVGLTSTLVLLPGTSFAATGVTTTFTSFSSSDIWESKLDQDWTVGDCTLLANRDFLGRPGGNWSYVRLAFHPSEAKVDVILFSASKTVQSPTDVWWSRLGFRTAFGTEVLAVAGLASAQMTRTNVIYPNEAGVTVPMDPQLFPLITSVQWKASC